MSKLPWSARRASAHLVAQASMASGDLPKITWPEELVPAAVTAVMAFSIGSASSRSLSIPATLRRESERVKRVGEERDREQPGDAFVDVDLLFVVVS